RCTTASFRRRSTTSSPIRSATSTMCPTPPASTISESHSPTRWALAGTTPSSSLARPNQRNNGYSKGQDPLGTTAKPREDSHDNSPSDETKIPYFDLEVDARSYRRLPKRGPERHRR